MGTFIEVEVDLSDYEDEVFEYAEDNGYIEQDVLDDYISKSEIKDLIDELEKELYFYTTKSITTVEQVVDKLKELI